MHDFGAGSANERTRAASAVADHHRRSVSNRRVWPAFPALDLALLVGLLLGQIADIATTDLALHRGGWEMNPLMALAQAHLGTSWWLPKFALMALAGLVVLSTRVRRFPVAIVVGTNWVPTILNLLQLF